MCPHCRLAVCECEHTGTRTYSEVMTEVRRLAAEHAAIEPRGFDSIQRRAHLHAQIDANLDELALRLDVAAIIDGRLPA